MIILDKVGDRGSFQAKLQALQSEGYIASRARNVLDAALDAGNAAAHRGHNPNADTVNEVMDIIESLLEAIYRHDGIAERLRASTPQRSRKHLRVVDPTSEGSGSAS
jgi:ethanolamine ammonia-lyase large subunit